MLVLSRRRRGTRVPGGERQLKVRSPRTRQRWTWHALVRRPIPHCIALVVLFLALYAFATSRLFAISQVQSIGDPRVPLSLVQARCGCMGKNIFLEQPAHLRSRLERTPWLEIREAYTRLPNRVIVNAVYRPTALLWRTATTTYTIDSLGRVLYDVRRPPVPVGLLPVTKTVPIVLDWSPLHLHTGQVIPSSGLPLKMISATRAWSTPSIAHTIDKYRWRESSGLVGHSRSGWWFYLGKGTGKVLHDRVAALNVMNAEDAFGHNHCNYVDLTTIPYPYCRYDPAWHAPNGPPRGA